MYVRDVCQCVCVRYLFLGDDGNGMWCLSLYCLYFSLFSCLCLCLCLSLYCLCWCLSLYCPCFSLFLVFVCVRIECGMFVVQCRSVCKKVTHLYLHLFSLSLSLSLSILLVL